MEVPFGGRQSINEIGWNFDPLRPRRSAPRMGFVQRAAPAPLLSRATGDIAAREP